MSKHMFWVAMSRNFPEYACASIVDEPKAKWFKSEIRAFYKEYAGHEIRHVDGDEMSRLMRVVPVESK